MRVFLVVCTVGESAAVLNPLVFTRSRKGGGVLMSLQLSCSTVYRATVPVI